MTVVRHLTRATKYFVKESRHEPGGRWSSWRTLPLGRWSAGYFHMEEAHAACAVLVLRDPTLAVLDRVVARYGLPPLYQAQNVKTLRTLLGEHAADEAKHTLHRYAVFYDGTASMEGVETRVVAGAEAVARWNDPEEVRRWIR